MSRPAVPVEPRFMSYVHIDLNGCWMWQGGKLVTGYGVFWNGQKSVFAHRWSYMHFKGEIPEGLHVDHLCDHPPCVNPDHLRVATRSENLSRRGRPMMPSLFDTEGGAA